jgi:peptidylprolyl isomerase
MQEAKNGSTVTVHYTGRLASGAVFDTSTEGEPLRFTLGEGNIIPGFERAVLGMKPGESATVTLEGPEAYGPHRPELVMKVERDRLPSDAAPEVGDRLEAQDGDGRRVPLIVVEVGEETVTVDANHPLAGQALTFEIEVVAVE